MSTLANGAPYLEPAYGILNARFVYEPAAGNYNVELWGKNLTDELYTTSRSSAAHAKWVGH